MKDKVVIAISGGVDSSVAALLLKEQGHEVVGITMCLGVAAGEGGHTKCCGPREIEDARRVCQMLEIPHYVMDFSGDLEEHIVRTFIEEYARGRTPNPCVACNRHIKFGTLLDKVTAMGFDFIATGHYARMERKEGRPALARSREARKDQTYFLHAIKREALDRIRFPLADLTKEEVRRIARASRLPVSDKQESQDICFIPEEGYGAFLRSRSIDVKPGQFVDREGNVLGIHRGYALYTTGQRARLGGWSGEPLYVLAIDAKKNRVVVGGKADLLAPGLVAERVNLLADDLPARCVAKIRYAHRGAACRVDFDGNLLRVVFDEPQDAITPGQYVVLYDDGFVLGGGVIREALT
ncbi:MAG: tRNA 2-thiouridine(34) synthase MnmA [Syntrophaceae bacterium]